MESLDEERKENYRDLQEKIVELDKTKEELERAKESSTQSWLDSKPLIDELEKLKSDLADSQNRSKSDIILPELETEFEITIKSIRERKKKEFETTKMIAEINQDLDGTNRELEKIKSDVDAEQRASGKLKQVLWVKKQTLRRSKLTLRAVRLESEAFRESLAETQRHINNAHSDKTVEISQEEYYALTRKAKEETRAAERRVTISMEEKLAAETSRNLALKRLKESYSGNRSRRRRVKEDMEKAEERQPGYMAVPTVNNRGLDLHEAREKPIANSVPPRRIMRSQSNRNKKMVKRKRASIFKQIRSFFKRSMTKLFG
ncbi:hypothetical protein ACFE04_022919 [Oxalis oulophora]